VLPYWRNEDIQNSPLTAHSTENQEIIGDSPRRKLHPESNGEYFTDFSVFVLIIAIRLDFWCYFTSFV